MKNHRLLHLPRPGTWLDLPPEKARAVLDVVQIIDVRRADEYFGELGHIEGSELVPLDTFDRAIDGWERNVPVLVVCRSGKRAAVACEKLVANGYEAVYNLAGGMMAWNEQSLPACASIHASQVADCERRT